MALHADRSARFRTTAPGGCPQTTPSTTHALPTPRCTPASSVSDTAAFACSCRRYGVSSYLCNNADENGDDGLCSECYFSNADVEWLAENYPHLLADDADESADDSQPQRRSRHATVNAGSNSATSRTATGHHHLILALQQVALNLATLRGCRLKGITISLEPLPQ